MTSPPKSAKAERIPDREALRQALSANAKPGAADRTAVRNLLNDTLLQVRSVAMSRLEAGDKGLAVARLLGSVTEDIICALYEHARMLSGADPYSRGFALVAVGGFGRGELAPYSDVDLLFVRAGEMSPKDAAAVEYMLYMLWDLGLKVGHSSRTVDECLKLARGDHTIETALLELRYLTGDKALADKLEQRFRTELANKGHARFIAAKLRERDERHARIGASRYMVEPNIKEGKGGLRDLHTLFWLARHRYGFSRLSEYVAAGVLTQDERRAFRRALEFLWAVRCHLHFIAGRAEEKLTFDLQPELAKRMGYSDRTEYSGVERFMKRYFLVAKEVGTLTRILCAKLEEDDAKSAPRGLKRLMPSRRARPEEVAPGFQVEQGRLSINSTRVLAKPANLLRLFSIAASLNVDVHPDALREATQRARTFQPAWRKDGAVREAFLAILTESRHPGAALRLMNEAGLLGKVVPEVGRIVAQMQFNMYHHYTVDEHTLQAIETISEIEHGRHKKQHPLATELFPKIINRRALYLAMLLHDTGKGGGDQQIEGEKSARAACERLGLPAEEVDLVGWLVRHHLEMSDIAQKRDISDPRTISHFARMVETLERLRLLLVLTVADIRAVGPNVWNDWKGQLLRDLYRLTETALRGGRSDEDSVRMHLDEMAANAMQKLREDLGDLAGLDQWLDAHEVSYWLNHDTEALAWHAREVLGARAAHALPHIAARLRPVQGVTEVLVYAGDRPGLFASLAAAISSCGANIAGARVQTTRDGAAFDIFSIQTSDMRPFGSDNPGAIETLITRLHGAVFSDHATPPAPALSRRRAAFAIEPWVRIDNDITPHATVIEASGRDRLGLLADLARACTQAGLSIASAHIDTYGERAADVFYVTIKGEQLSPSRIVSVRAKLEEVLRAAEPSSPGQSKSRLAVAPASTAR